MLRILLLCMLLLPYVNALACFPVVISLVERSKSADNIFVGYVTGIQLDDFQQSLRLNKPNGSHVITSGGEQKTITVWVTDDLKTSTIIQREIHPIVGRCGSGDAQLKEKVIVFENDSFWFVTTFTPNAYELIKQSILSPK